MGRDTPMNLRFGYVIHYVDDVLATVEFYEAAFGLTRRFVTPEADYGELDTGETTLAFAANELALSNLAAAGGFAPLRPGAPPPAISITMLTDDVAGALQVALDAGARPYVEPVEKPWGQTVAYVLDVNGTLVELATPVAA